MSKRKYYALAMFPYPSGAAMHVGHASNYLITDFVSISKRMQGYDVIYPFGYDSFGLPTENYAIKNGLSAQEATDNNIKHFEEQIRSIGFAFDKEREFRTSDPKYYKRTQWIFKKLFEHGLVYKKDGLVNRCIGCQTVLANDQVVDGKCERCETIIIQKKHPQRYIKITDYADQLIDDLDDLDWPEETKTVQKNWIGRSFGTEVDFTILDPHGGDSRGINSNNGMLNRETGKKHYLIFDFDGVLADTYTNAISARAKASNISLEEAKNKLDNYVLHKPNHSKEHNLSQQEFDHLKERTINFGHHLSKNPLPLFDKFARAIKHLDAQIAIVSTGTRIYIEPTLAQLDLQPSHVLTFEDHHSKEEKIAQVCKDRGVSAQEVYYFTDTLADIYELENYMDKKKIIGCSWGYCGATSLERVLPKDQILYGFDDILRLFTHTANNNQSENDDEIQLRTIKAYNQGINEYIRKIKPHVEDYGKTYTEFINKITELALSHDGHIFEIGSGTGRDADYREKQGCTVERTDVADSFIKYQTEQGKTITKFDGLKDKLDKKHNLIAAIAVAHHFTPTQLSVFLNNVYHSLENNGHFAFNTLEGDGFNFSQGIGGERYQQFLGQEDIEKVLQELGFEINYLTRYTHPNKGDIPGKTRLQYIIKKTEKRKISRQKNVLIIHGYHDEANTGRRERIANELTKTGVQCFQPQCDHHHIDLQKDIDHIINKYSDKINEQTTIIGYSLGGVTAKHVINKLGRKIERLITVASSFSRPASKEESNDKLLLEYRNTPIDASQLESLVHEHIAIFSKNDPVIPYEMAMAHRKQYYPKATILSLDDKSHFNKGAGVTQLPELLNLISDNNHITVFTTRPDTLYGVTAVVLAPENEILDSLISPQKQEELRQYRAEVAKMSSIDRQSTDRSKTGFDSGIQVIHPLTGELLPVWYADYVLMDYATGAVMFVPAHDERDREFAQKYKLPCKQVCAPYFEITSGRLGIRDDMPTIEREMVSMIIKHPSEDKYLLMKRKDSGAMTIPSGGIENQDSIFDTAQKELHEESGYKNIRSINNLNREVHFQQFAPHKSLNRYGRTHIVYIELENLEKDPVDAEELALHEAVWVSKDEVTKTQDLEVTKHIWEYYLHGYVNTAHNKLINSGQFNGLNNETAKTAITEHLESIGKGRKKKTFRLRDWSVSRQRYRGSPIPMYYTFADNQKVPYYSSRDDFPESYGNRTQPGKPVVTRHNAKVIIKHWSEEKYLVLHNETFGYHRVGGGIDEGESFLQAALREAKEETPYENFQLIQELPGEVHNDFYQPRKQENRYLIEHFVVLQLTNDQQSNTHREAHEGFTYHWMEPQKIGDLLQYKNEKHGRYQYYDPSKIPSHRTIDRYNAYNPHPDKSKRIPHPIPDEDLPVILPLDLPNYKPAGKSPLEDHPTFKYYRPSNNKITTLSNQTSNNGELRIENGELFLRECDTLDTFMCSSFYYLRFLNPQDNDHLISPGNDAYMPVDIYVGGKEHTVGHLIYSRFIYKFLKNIGAIHNDSKEPFKKLVHQGMIQGPDGRKMSKRRGNIIDPTQVIRDNNRDTLRTYIAFMGPIELQKNRNPEAVTGANRFLKRFEKMADMVVVDSDGQATNKQLQSLIHQTIKGVTDDIDNLKFNTAISKLMIATNAIYDASTQHSGESKVIDGELLSKLILIIVPFAQETAQRMRDKLGYSGKVTEQAWPSYDEGLINSQTIQLPIQINGKTKGNLSVAKDASQEEVIKLVRQDEKLGKYLNTDIKKIIRVPGKICNIIL